MATNNYVPPANNGQTRMKPLNYIVLTKPNGEGSSNKVGSALVGTATAG